MPWWYRSTQRALRLAYPGVGPWEWEERPEWRKRVLASLDAEQGAAEMIRNAQKQQKQQE